MKASTNKISVFVMAAFVMLVWQGVPSGEEPPEFVGAKKCKMCHKKKEVGEQFKIWSEAKHSEAFELLASEKAQKVAAELGIEDPQKSGQCLKCHSTAYFLSEELVSNISVKKSGKPRLTVEEGVSCESCHWAGSAYQKKKVMADFDASVKAGMNPCPEKSCVKCHNDQNPTWNAEKYTLKDGTKAGFDFDQAWDMIKHPNPKLAAERAKKKSENQSGEK